jgi:hypothetical protein
MPLTDEEREAYAELEASFRKVALMRDAMDPEDVITDWAFIGSALNSESLEEDTTRYVCIYPGGTLAPHIAAGLHVVWGRLLDQIIEEED